MFNNAVSLLLMEYYSSYDIEKALIEDLNKINKNEKSLYYIMSRGTINFKTVDH